jgi:hypothetical protein
LRLVGRFLLWLRLRLRRNSIRMTDSGFGSVHPFNRLGSPLFLVLVNVGPFCLWFRSLGLETCGQVDSVLLLEFFVRVVFGGDRWCSCFVVSMRQGVDCAGGTDAGSCSTRSWHPGCLCRRLSEYEERRANRCYRFSQSDGVSHSVVV